MRVSVSICSISYIRKARFVDPQFDLIESRSRLAPYALRARHDVPSGAVSVNNKT
jgi:hypothetical protein